ncbi:MAG: cupin domain-containing protein [Ignavibacteriaceae bacterium]
MKAISILFILLFSSSLISAQSDTVLSKVYSYNQLSFEKFDDYEKKQILNGSTTDNENLDVYVLSLEPGKSLDKVKSPGDAETLIMIKEGEPEVTIKGESKLLVPGSIVYLMPGERFSISNTGKDKVVYYVLEYNPKKITSNEEEAESAVSFMINWNDIKFNPHDKGGIRQYFERPTSMFRRFEMHVTTLNSGIKSHEPHTHRAEEIVLMIKGKAEMQIGESFYTGTDGDLFFLGANIPHAIRNTDDEDIMYFAFQWD